MSKLLEKINKKEFKLASLLEVTSSKRIYLSEYKDHGIPFFRSKEIIQASKGDKIFSELFISKERYEEVKNKFGVPKIGDILLTSIGTIGIPYIVQNEQPFYFKDGNLTWFKNYNGIDSQYLYYWIISSKGQLQIKGSSIGSSQSALTIDSIKKIDIEIPDFPTQKKIASILSAYDAKIENNNKIIKNLEATAQTIFNEWFVNFKFPGYKKVKMVESELGEIPEGWKIQKLDEIADFLNGVASQKYPAEKQSDSFPVIKIREMNSGIDKNSDRATRNIDTKYIIENGDILFAWSGSLSVVVWIGEAGILNQHIFKVTSKNYSKWFIYQHLRRHLQEFKSIAEGKATTMGHIQRHHLSEVLVLIPDAFLLKKADAILNNLFEKQISLQVENISLKSQRDQLLEKLI